MPARDGTGPFGTGPIGRGLGPCGGNEQEYDQPLGLGLAHRRGQRFGNRRPRWGWGANFADPAMVNDTRVLVRRQNWLKEQLAAVTREIEKRNEPSD